MVCRSFERWKGVTKIEHFIIGEFYEVINASRHCRRHAYLSNHDKYWLNLLKFFMGKPNLEKRFLREAIYEYLWLKLRPDEKFKLPMGDLLGNEELIRFYFHDITEFPNAVALEDANSLLQITFAAITQKKVEITFKEITSWFKALLREVNKQLKATVNPNEKCHLLEIIGTMLMVVNQKRKRKSPNDFIKYFEEILLIIDTAPYYFVSQLGDRINQFINLFIYLNEDENSEVITALQLFSEKLDIKVQERESFFRKGKNHVNWGRTNIYTDNPSHILKALNHFHKTREHWNTQESIEGHVLSLMNISQLYSSIDLNFAAKYYALAGVWVSINNGEKDLLKRIGDSLSLVFHADFKQGSWLMQSCHLDFLLC